MSTLLGDRDRVSPHSGVTDSIQHGGSKVRPRQIPGPTEGTIHGGSISARQGQGWPRDRHPEPGDRVEQHPTQRRHLAAGEPAKGDQPRSLWVPTHSTSGLHPLMFDAYIRSVYTGPTMAAPRRVIWDADNRKHLLVDHADRGVNEAQITYAVVSAKEDNVFPDSSHGTMVGMCAVGRRVLTVAWIIRPGGGCYPVHAHWAGKRERRLLR